MSRSNRYALTAALALLVTTLILTGIMAVPVKAHAAQIEGPDRVIPMSQVYVTYAEPIGTVRFPNRHYFELSNGATYIHVTYGSCVRADLVPDRLCRTVFWYAR